MSYDFLYRDSSFTSDQYYQWFCELGHRDLDIMRWEDGEWAILQMFNAPVIPSMTKFNYILKGMKNVEPTRSFVKKYVEIIDLTKKAFWEREEESEKALDQKEIDKEKFQDELIERRFEACRRNPELMERVAKFGVQELSLEKIYANLTPYQKRRLR